MATPSLLPLILSPTAAALRRDVAARTAASDVAGLRAALFAAFASSPAHLAACMASTLPGDSPPCIVVDLAELHRFYESVSDHCEETFANAITTLLDRIRHGLMPLSHDSTAALLVIMECPVFLNADALSQIMPKLCHVLATLTQQQRADFIATVHASIRLSAHSKEDRAHLFRQLVNIIQQFLTLRIVDKEDEPAYSASQDDAIVWAIQSLAIFVSINEFIPPSPTPSSSTTPTPTYIPYYEFYNESIEAAMDLKEDYPKWKSRDGFSFCDYPFLLSTAAKGDILRIESMIQMRHELQDAFFRAMFIGVNSPYLQIEIRRDHVIRDTLYQLEGKNQHDLKKQLRVTFIGEEGIDEGGVQKEFFQLVVREMFDPAYGMFQYNDQSRLCWFTRSDGILDKQTLEEYTLMGQIIGLAIYNGAVLDIHLPLALYKKLMDVPVTLDDLSELDPDLGRGLEQLLTFDGDVEDTYSRTFAVDIDTAIGERRTQELCPDGKNRPVTAENRQEFVDLYIDFLFTTSVAEPFTSFRAGVDTITSNTAITIFRPQELQELVCGSPSLDFDALERVTQYDGGFDRSTPVIEFFWQVVHAFSDEQKKLLLFFTTGSDRVPAGGLSKLQFMIVRNGPDSDRVPTSHTCYNILLLSEYATKDKLKDRLLTALANSNCGFFLN